MTIVAGSLASAADVNAALATKASTTDVAAKANSSNPNFTGTMTLGGVVITGYGSSVGNALGPLTDVGGGIPGMRLSSRLFLRRNSTGESDFADFQVQRDTAFTSSASTNVNNTFLASVNVGANDGTANWAALNQVKTSSTSNAGQSVATYSQAWRLAGSNSPMWSSVLETRDATGSASSVTMASLVGQENGNTANGADDAANIDSFGGLGIRIGLNMVFGQATNNATPAEFVNAIRIKTSVASGNNSFINSALGFANGARIRQALDTRGAIAPAGVTDPMAAVRMTAGHIVDFHGGSSIDSAPGNYWWYDNATSKMKYNVGSTTVLSIDNSGNVRALGTITASVTP